MSEKYLNLLQNFFESNTNEENAYSMKKYMLNKFEYFGIKSPERRELTRSFLKEKGPPDKNELELTIKTLWEFPQREYQYFAIELTDKFIKKADKNIIGLLEYMITSKSWWDTVDSIAAKLVGTHFLNYPEMIVPYTEKWMSSDDMWLQRSAILFQLKYKDKTDFKLLTKYINMCLGSKEFFIQKAIGWTLREYSKTDPQTVIDFIDQTDLAPLSRREGLKWMKNQGIID